MKRAADKPPRLSSISIQSGEGSQLAAVICSYGAGSASAVIAFFLETLGLGKWQE